MDAKITKVRLGRMLSYDWLKIIGTAAAIILFWVLLFTMTATRVKSSQQFNVCNYLGNTPVSSKLTRDLSNAKKDGVFSYEVIEVGSVDMAIAKDAASQLLQARTATDELDVMFISMLDDPSSKYTEGEGDNKVTKYRYSYLEDFLMGYCYDLHNLSLGEGGYFKNMEAYLNGYYNGDYTNADNLDKEKIETDFRARVKSKKDKRYKKESQIKKGVKGEIERVQKYRDALITFYAYLDGGYVEIVKSTYIDEDGADLLQDKGTYSINICPDTSPKFTETNNALKEYVSYNIEDEEGTETLSAANMNVCLFNSNGKLEAFRYEGLVYVIHLLKTVCPLS